MSSPVSVFKTTPKIIIGIGAIEALPREIGILGGRNVLIVTDEGVTRAGICDRVVDTISKHVHHHAIFGTVPPEPPIEAIEACLSVARDAKADLVIGVGGGSSMDVAKVVSVLMTNQEPLLGMFGLNLVKKRGLPHILIPTTAGTGSEVTPIAILTDQQERIKKGVVSDFLFPEVALLDAQQTVSLPPFPTAASGMDALIHAVEAFTSLNATPYTDYLAERAMRLIVSNIRSAWANGENLDARLKMLEGSLLAGQAFANAGVTAVHAFAYPLGGEFHLAHGVANTVMLCPVMRFNMLANLGKFASMGEILCPDAARSLGSFKQKAAAGINLLEELATDMHLPLRLSVLNIPIEAIDRLSEGVLKVTRLLANNPRKIGFEDAKKIYLEAY